MTNMDFYSASKPDSNLFDIDILYDSNVANFLLPNFQLLLFNISEKFANLALLLFHINQLIKVCYFCISPLVAKNIIVIVYSKGQPGYLRYYKIISRFWYI